MNYETQRNQKRGGSTPDDQIKRGVLPHLCIDCRQQNPFPAEVAMRGLTAEPRIIADDAVLDVIFEADAGNEVGMLCETVSRGLCRLLLLAAARAGLPADVLFNKSLDLKIRFRTPTADDFFNGTAYWEDE